MKRVVMNFASQARAGLVKLFAELDRAADRLVPWIDRVLAWARHSVRQVKTEASSLEGLYSSLGRRAHELLNADAETLRNDARILELLAAIARRQEEERARQRGEPVPNTAAHASTS